MQPPDEVIQDNEVTPLTGGPKISAFGVWQKAHLEVPVRRYTHWAADSATLIMDVEPPPIEYPY